MRTECFADNGDPIQVKDWTPVIEREKIYFFWGGSKYKWDGMVPLVRLETSLQQEGQEFARRSRDIKVSLGWNTMANLQNNAITCCKRGEFSVMVR